MKYFLPLVILLASCGKGNDQPAPKSKSETLASGTWKYESGGVDQDKNGTIDISFEASGVVQPCLLDNTVTFQTNGNGVADEGATKCNVNQPQTSNFTWSFQSNETVLNVTGAALFGGGQFKVTTLTDTKLTLSKDTLITYLGAPLNLTIIANMKH